MFVNMTKYKSSDGTGRDTYISRETAIQSGKTKLPASQYESINRINEFWARNDAVSRTIKPTAKSIELSPPDSKRRLMSLSTKSSSRANSTLAPSPKNNLLAKSLPNSYRFEQDNIIQPKINTELTRKEREAQIRFGKFNHDFRIPGYSGHVPASKDTVGTSPFKSGWMDKQASPSGQTSPSTYSTSFAGSKPEKYNSTVPIPSFKEIKNDVTSDDIIWRDKEVRQKINTSLNMHLLSTAKPESTQGGVYSARQPSTLVKTSPVRYVSSARNHIKITDSHHISGFAGHVPRSKEVTVYETSRNPITYWK